MQILIWFDATEGFKKANRLLVVVMHQFGAVFISTNIRTLVVPSPFIGSTMLKTSVLSQSNQRPQKRTQKRCPTHSRKHCNPLFKSIISRTDPATNRPLKDRTLVPNDNLRQLIADLAPMT